MICLLTGSRSVIKHLPERPGDVKHSLAATDELRAAGFVAGGDFDRGMRETIDFYARALQVKT